ncbi:MAG: lasso peptide biosynthesis B2 protein [Vicinamibacterales bacterium]
MYLDAGSSLGVNSESPREAKWSRSVASFRALNSSDRWLVVEAMVLLVVTCAGLRTLHFALLLRLVDRLANNTRWLRVLPNPPLHRIEWAVAAAARRLPVSTTCLVRALAADMVLRRRGHASTLRIGVRRQKSNECTAPLEAHAWIECDGRVIVGGRENLASYAVLDAPLSGVRGSAPRPPTIWT